MDLLQTLTQLPGVPGREGRVRAFIEDYLATHSLFDEVRTDVMGSLVAVRKPRTVHRTENPTRVLLAAHMDQIGFLVSHISDEGHLRVQPVGAFDVRNLFSRHVTVCTSGGDLPGVMNVVGKPIHTSREEERKRIPEIEDFYIDLSMRGDAVRERVKLGDMVVLDSPFREIGDSIVSQALDNRVGCWAIVRAIEQLTTHDCEIHAVWTVQEELGSRGAEPVAYAINPDIGLCCDTMVCCKTPGIPDEQRVTVPGAGVALQIADCSTIADAGLVDDIEEVARQQKIRCQRALSFAGGQDGAAIQRTRRGVRTAVFACPSRTFTPSPRWRTKTISRAIRR